MAEWVSHLIVADRVLEQLPHLKRHEFCVGNIAPDCNIPNENWTEFTPPRQVTHWMQGKRKRASDCDRFYKEYIVNRLNEIQSKEELSFLLGYYSHLITDAELQRTIRDENRVAAAWERAKKIPELRAKAEGLNETWDSFKILFPNRNERMKDFYVIEREYLDGNPDSGYITEICGLEEFPDYIDYLPHDCIVRKIRIMGQIPEVDGNIMNPITISREEHQLFVNHTADLVLRRLSEKGCVSFAPGKWKGTMF